MNNSICTLFDNILIDIHKFKSLHCIKHAIQHKIIEKINNLIDLQGFFNKIVVCFIFINIFAFC